MYQLFHIELGRVDGAEVGADRLSLYGKLDLFIGDIASHGSIELVCFSAASCRRAAASVEEYDMYIVFLREQRQFLFGLIDAPVGHEVAPVLRAVGKAQHNGLCVIAPLQV